MLLQGLCFHYLAVPELQLRGTKNTVYDDGGSSFYFILQKQPFSYLSFMSSGLQ